MTHRPGRFGPYGGRYVAETLIPALEELERAYEGLREDPSFREELADLLHRYSGRPTPLTQAPRLTEALGGPRILLKREDLNHTGSHKINNALGQVLLAARMGKRRVLAETGAGQHGVAAATAAARFGLECRVYMGAEDMARQSLNVDRMRLLGAEVVPVTSGAGTLKDATSEAIRAWSAQVEDTHFVLGSVVGPRPYPALVRDFQRVIGDETRRQCLETEGRLPDLAVACVGGGSNSMGMFAPFLEDRDVRLVGVEAAGEGLETGRHAATLSLGTPGVLHGSFAYLLQDEDGQVKEAHSISAGLDYPGVGPQHSFLKDTGRVEYRSATDREALEALSLLCRTEGILPALESAHALAGAAQLAPSLRREDLLVVCLSGRGDKDLPTVLGQGKEEAR